MQNKISDMVVARDSAELLTWRASMIKDGSVNFTKEVAIAKLVANEAATMRAHQEI